MGWLTSIPAWLRRYWSGGRNRYWRWARRAALVLFVLLVPAPVLFLLFFRFVPIPFTPQMAAHLVTFRPVHYSWVSFDDLPPALGRAVIGAEDQNFCAHNGFDWAAIDKAMDAHERNPNRRLRGASTISQQTARTVFLVSSRSWIRKGVEAYLTVLMEALWPKRRILTAYLNLVDWGRGNYGADAAARAYFNTPAARLGPAQAARLAAILPNPSKWQAARPGPYVARRSVTLQGRAAMVVRDGLDSCVR